MKYELSIGGARRILSKINQCIFINFPSLCKEGFLKSINSKINKALGLIAFAVVSFNSQSVKYNWSYYQMGGVTKSSFYSWRGNAVIAARNILDILHTQKWP